MNDGLGVGGVESIGHLNAYFENLADAQRAVLEKLAEGLAFKKLHDQEGAALHFPNIMDNTYIGVVESTGGAGLAMESLEDFPGRMKIVREKFDGHTATETSICRTPDDAHTAAAKWLFEPIVVE